MKFDLRQHVRDHANNRWQKVGKKRRNRDLPSPQYAALGVGAGLPQQLIADVIAYIISLSKSRFHLNLLARFLIRYTLTKLTA